MQIEWWWTIPAFVAGGVVSYLYAKAIYAKGEALYNQVVAAASAEEKKVLGNIKARL